MLHTAGYEIHRLRSLLGLTASVDVILSDIGRHSLYYLDSVSASDDPAAVLLELVLLCGEVPDERCLLIGPQLVGVLTELDLDLVETLPGSQRRGTVAITECAHRHFLSDRLFEHGPDELTLTFADDGCMPPPHASSIELRRSVANLDAVGGSFLDMGCGTGCQSQLLDSGEHPAWAWTPALRQSRARRSTASPPGTRTASASFTPIRPCIRGSCSTLRTSATAFAFVNTTLRDLLGPRGVAQVWCDVEISAVDAKLDGLFRRMIPDLDAWQIGTDVDRSSPYSLSPVDIRARRLPQRSLLADAGGRDAYFDGLTEREVVEVQSAVLSLAAR